MGMNINLTPQLEEMVRQRVTSGLYTSASEVVREALRLMEEKDQLRAATLEQLRNNIQERLNSGPATPGMQRISSRQDGCEAIQKHSNPECRQRESKISLQEFVDNELPFGIFIGEFG